jgi:Protein of unknown function DUF262
MTDLRDVRPLIPESSTSESTTVEVVLNELRDGAIEIPDYQRDSDQWDAPTKSLLIESVINNLSIPAFFFEVTHDELGLEKNQIIDGQQRITTLNQFFQGRFKLVDSGEAAFISPNSLHYAGKYYAELPAVYQQAFKRYRLAVIKLRDLKGMRLEVFRRINQGGTPLSGQDIRLAYYGESSPSLAFIRLVGIYDGQKQAAQRFRTTAKAKYGLDLPWESAYGSATWKDLWEDKELARGQTASEMFLFSLMAAQHSELDVILQNTSALAKLNVNYNKSIDDALDVVCAQLNYQDRNPDAPPILYTLDTIRDGFFPYFSVWVDRLGAYGPSLDVRKHRTMASIIGAGYRSGIPASQISVETWGHLVEFVRRPTEISQKLGIEWPQSKGRWDGAKGHRAQLETASAIVAKICQ